MRLELVIGDVWFMDRQSEREYNTHGEDGEEMMK